MKILPIKNHNWCKGWQTFKFLTKYGTARLKITKEANPKSILLLSFLELRNSVSKLTSLRVFERVFLFFWSSINLSIGLSGDTNLLDCSAILKNSLNYEQLEYTENIILSKLPDKASRDDREKARENMIHLNRGLWLDETIFARVRNSFRLSDWSK